MFVGGKVQCDSTTPAEITKDLDLSAPLVIQLRYHGATSAAARVGDAGVTSLKGYTLDSTAPEITVETEAGDRVFVIATQSSASVDFLAYTKI